jgi:hypothetical protein
MTDGYLGTSNSTDLRQAIRENAAVRFELLSLSVRRAGKDEHKLWSAAYGYGSFCEPVAGDVDALNSPELTAVVRQHEESQAAHRAKQKPIRKARDERLKVSQGFKKELLGMLDGLRDGTSTNGLARVAAWLLRTNPNSRYGEVQPGGIRARGRNRDCTSGAGRLREGLAQPSACVQGRRTEVDISHHCGWATRIAL